MPQRCAWCNGRGELVELPAAHTATPPGRLLVHPQHEQSMRRMLSNADQRARRLVSILGAALIAAIPALAIAAAFGAAAVTAAAGTILAAIGLAAWRFPVAMPALTHARGARTALAVTRGIAILCAATGALLVLAALGV